MESLTLYHLADVALSPGASSIICVARQNQFFEVSDSSILIDVLLLPYYY